MDKNLRFVHEPVGNRFINRDAIQAFSFGRKGILNRLKANPFASFFLKEGIGALVIKGKRTKTHDRQRDSGG